MKHEEIQSLINLRETLITAHKRLDGRTSPKSAIMRQTEAAEVYEIAIKKLDKILGKYVKFS